MENHNPSRYLSVLPHIIGILHRQPRQSATLDDMCHKVEESCQTDEVMLGHIRSFDTTKNAVEHGIGLGIGMGLLFNSNGIVRLAVKLPIRSPGNGQSPGPIAVDYEDRRRRVKMGQQPLSDEVETQLLFSDENGRQPY